MKKPTSNRCPQPKMRYCRSRKSLSPLEVLLHGEKRSRISFAVDAVRRTSLLIPTTQAPGTKRPQDARARLIRRPRQPHVGSIRLRWPRVSLTPPRSRNLNYSNRWSLSSRSAASLAPRPGNIRRTSRPGTRNCGHLRRIVAASIASVRSWAVGKSGCNPHELTLELGG
jgi:hypothetical protein